jgi:hypothetical protein
LIALLKLGADPTETPITALISSIRARHISGSYFSVATMPEAAPSWAILEASSGLALYAKSLAETGHLSIVRNIYGELTAHLATVSDGVKNLNERIGELEGELAQLNGQLKRGTLLAQQIAHIGQILRKPATKATLVILITLAALLAYLITTSGRVGLGDHIIGIATIIVPAIALFELVRRSAKRS